MQTLGSQRLFQIAVTKRPELLLQALRRGGALGRREQVEWKAPLAKEGFKEYRDTQALRHLGVPLPLSSPLKEFWPPRGQVWDGLGVSSAGRPILVEAKAHIPETLSGPSRASEASLKLIESSMDRARKYFSPRTKASWNGAFYQYANRLAFQYFLHRLNGIESRLVYLYFTNAVDMDGPATEREWQGAIRLIHAALGIPADLKKFGVFKAFVDASSLTDQK